MNPGAKAAGTRRVTAKDLATVNARLEGQTPREILGWAYSVFGNRMAVLSAFQKAGCVIVHQLHALGLSNHVDVLFVDTGVNFRETYETVERVEKAYGLRVVRLHPRRTMEQQTREEGVLYLSVDGQKRCCDLRKKEPLREIVGKYDALIGGLQRSSGGNRADVPVLATDEELNTIRVHPLAAWTAEMIDAYIREHAVLYNPLHDQGYPTVSCDRCTTPVLPGEPERAGRWRHLENAVAYCNINPTDRKKGSSAEEAGVWLAESVVERLLKSAGV